MGWHFERHPRGQNELGNSYDDYAQLEPVYSSILILLSTAHQPCGVGFNGLRPHHRKDEMDVAPRRSHARLYLVARSERGI